MIGRMAVDEDAQAGIAIPLTRGGFVPADASRFKGVRMNVRGEGPFEAVIMTAHLLAALGASPPAPRAATSTSRSARSKPVRDGGAWDARTLVTVGVVARRPAGTKAWLELDDVTFY